MIKNSKYSLEIRGLIEAMFDLLDDMGPDRMFVSDVSKAQARIAYEPFLADDELEYLMSIEEARRIVKEIT